jgi:hypothetical protein
MSLSPAVDTNVHNGPKRNDDSKNFAAEVDFKFATMAAHFANFDAHFDAHCANIISKQLSIIESIARIKAGKVSKLSLEAKNPSVLTTTKTFPQSIRQQQVLPNTPDDFSSFQDLETPMVPPFLPAARSETMYGANICLQADHGDFQDVFQQPQDSRTPSAYFDQHINFGSLKNALNNSTYRAPHADVKDIFQQRQDSRRSISYFDQHINLETPWGPQFLPAARSETMYGANIRLQADHGDFQDVFQQPQNSRRSIAYFDQHINFGSLKNALNNSTYYSTLVRSIPKDLQEVTTSEDTSCHESEDYLPVDYVPFQDLSASLFNVEECHANLLQVTSADLGEAKSLFDIDITDDYVIVQCIVPHIDCLVLSYLNYAYLRKFFDPGIIHAPILLLILLLNSSKGLTWVLLM